ncbi:MAG TPA: amidohydrolase [Candidatus Eisenbacteria bacterium]|nr:amidohydrolase [Candidatus Eisenbacteria bacterium]
MTPRTAKAANERRWLFHGGTLLDAPRAAKPLGAASKRSGGEALLVRGEVIEAVGPLSTLRKLAGRGVESYDLRGGALLPGFVDAHVHLVSWLRVTRDPSFGAEQTPDALASLVRTREKSLRPGEWLTVRGWIARDWPAEALVRATLDRIAPDRPLVLFAADGHSVWANGTALALCGVTGHTRSPEGGVIVRDARGEPTGQLVEDAANLVRSRVPRLDDPAEELRDAVAAARRLGITSAHDFDAAVSGRRAAEDLDRNGRLGLRLLKSIPVASLDAAEEIGLRHGFGSERLHVGPVKMFADGTLGSSTALLESPYEGTANVGIAVTSPEELREKTIRAAKAGLAVAIHAIGDRAVRHALDAFEAALAEGLRFPAPPRVEHVQLAREADFARFQRLGAAASVQPIHMLTDQVLARRIWGGRTGRSYAWKSLLRAKAALYFGSDAPYDRPGPVLGLQAAVLRRDPAGPPDAYHGEQRLRLAEALRAHVESPHAAAGWNVRLGRLEPGWGADLVHLSHDLRALPPEEWRRARVLGSWVAGSNQIPK